VWTAHTVERLPAHTVAATVRTADSAHCRAKKHPNMLSCSQNYFLVRT
jgi:hypothetical protein